LELVDEGYISLNNDEISLTDLGKEKAGHLYENHMIIEDIFKQDYDEETAHVYAHVLEHIISKEVIESMKKIEELRMNDIALIESTFHEGIITQLKITDKQLVERIISMGVCPGQKIEIIARLKAGIVVRLKHTQLAIDNQLAKDIMIANVS
jgi:Fe2+ transport system protein FeoA